MGRRRPGSMSRFVWIVEEQKKLVKDCGEENEENGNLIYIIYID